MEQNQSALFSLTIDPITKAHLSETAKWARFLAIVGMIFMFLALIGIIWFAYSMTSNISSFEEEYGGQIRTGPFGDFGVGLAVMYIIILIIYFFPLMYLLRFASRMKKALHGNDQQALNVSFQYLKICFRYIGIITIIFLVLYAILIIFGLGAAALM